MFWKKKASEEKAKTISGSQYWRCPNCGMVLKKKAEAAARIKAMQPLEQAGATVVDLARCSGCGATCNTKDVYLGKYDVDM